MHKKNWIQKKMIDSKHRIALHCHALWQHVSVQFHLSVGIGQCIRIAFDTNLSAAGFFSSFLTKRCIANHTDNRCQVDFDKNGYTIWPAIFIWILQWPRYMDICWMCWQWCSLFVWFGQHIKSNRIFVLFRCVWHWLVRNSWLSYHFKMSAFKINRQQWNSTPIGWLKFSTERKLLTRYILFATKRATSVNENTGMKEINQTDKNGWSSISPSQTHTHTHRDTHTRTQNHSKFIM